MRRMRASIVVAGAALLLGPDAALAANRDQQLLMAELRMLQQNQQQMQQMILTLADALKAVSGKLDEQTAAERKALADQRLLVEGMTDTVRVLREKADDTNVRLSSITQELEAIRQTIAAAPTLPATPASDPTADPQAGDAGAAPAPVAPPPANMSPQRTYDSAFSDYAAGQYDLAIVGFETFLKFFPRHPSADDAQLNIGNSYYGAGKYKEAVSAFQQVISDYPQTESAPAAYYKLGLAHSAMKQTDAARTAFETLLERYPESREVFLARQALERLRKSP